MTPNVGGNRHARRAATARERRGVATPALPWVADPAGAAPARPSPVSSAHQAAAARAYDLLSRGDYRAGWPAYRQSLRLWFQATGRRWPAGPEWDGAPQPDGALCIRADQGLGDMVMFGRFVAPAAARFGGRVVLTVAERFIPAFARAFPDLTIAPDGATVQASAWCMLSSVPDILGIAQDALPPPLALPPDPAAVRGWGDALAAMLAAGAYRVGLAWRGSKDSGARSWPLAAAAPVATLPGVAPILLQPPGDRGEAGLDECGFVSYGAARDDRIDDTLAVLMACDLVISLDSLICHLAGSLGRRVWVALPSARDCDWRWGTTGDRSPWYPTARLWRQPRPGAWGDVFAAMARELAALVANRGAVG